MSISEDLAWLREILECLDYLGTGSNSKEADIERQENLTRFDALVDNLIEAGAVPVASGSRPHR